MQSSCLWTAHPIPITAHSHLRQYPHPFKDRKAKQHYAKAFGFPGLVVSSLFLHKRPRASVAFIVSICGKSSKRNFEIQPAGAGEGLPEPGPVEGGIGPLGGAASVQPGCPDQGSSSPSYWPGKGKWGSPCRLPNRSSVLPWTFGKPLTFHTSKWSCGFFFWCLGILYISSNGGKKITTFHQNHASERQVSSPWENQFLVWFSSLFLW